MGGRIWKPQELAYLREHIDTVPIKSIAQKLKRTENAVKLKAQRMGFDVPLYSTEYLSSYALARMLDVECKTIMRWKKLGLKYTKKNGRYLHKHEDIIKFMYEHQDYWDATRGDMCLVNSKPWFAAKYEQDKKKRAQYRKHNTSWNEYEARELVRLKERGWNYKKLSERYQRSPLACKLKYHSMKGETA